MSLVGLLSVAVFIAVCYRLVCVFSRSSVNCRLYRCVIGLCMSLVGLLSVALFIAVCYRLV